MRLFHQQKSNVIEYISNKKTNYQQNTQQS
jgi:hypothetical protein